MVGNDVVDLGDAETRGGPSHPRFDARVFAPSELAALAASADRDALRWILWAAKEAGYKLAVKRWPGIVFSPRRFVVTLHDGSGRVHFPAGVAEVTVHRHGDAVHAVARFAAGPGIVSAVDVRSEPPAPAEASRAVRELARERLAAALGVSPRALRFGRRGRVPTLELSGDPRRFDLSLSHHGRCLAFACAGARR